VEPEPGTLREAEWIQIASSPGDYHFVVTGSDTRDNAGNSYPQLQQTGSYWSGAEKFSVIPASKAELDLTPLLDGLEEALAALQQAINSQVYGAEGLPNMGGLASLPLLATN
jgi:hypothetical protein